MKKYYVGHHVAQAERRRPLARVTTRELSRGQLAAVAGGYISWDILAAAQSGGATPDPDPNA